MIGSHSLPVNLFSKAYSKVLINSFLVEKPSMEEFFTELKSKWHNLKPESERPRPAEQPKEDPKWIQIYNHFQRQKKLRKSNQN